MIKTLRITIRVHDQEEALCFYTQKLGFEKRADFSMGANRRWVTVAPQDDQVLELVLQPSDWFEGEERQSHAELVGKNPTIVFQVDDCQATFEQLQAEKLNFQCRPPI
ncbi:VOC family protein [Dictyobacter aurantiacus]|uniref:VOC domain-containing protein n=1 Tax=Dictyobacter aurantiacus TaxID=1936993 RepID=A0A401ZSW3_9CHLR|nr:VOC family protein [Dictyobacter aurantiacus]GCE09979.1 hypothetical protein KDAU_73080 [Dictyobacter aurantiacus]